MSLHTRRRTVLGQVILSACYSIVHSRVMHLSVLYKQCACNSRHSWAVYLPMYVQLSVF